jgi:flagellar biogenesis protein FliO
MGLLSRIWNWFKARQQARSCTRHLQIAATASLGEKRFVALIQLDELQFLIGGGPASVVLLAQVNAKERFDDMLKENMSAPTHQRAKRVAKPAARAELKRMVKPAAKLAPKPIVAAPARLTLKPMAKPALKKPVKPQVAKQTARQTRKQA